MSEVAGRASSLADRVHAARFVASLPPCRTRDEIRDGCGLTEEQVAVLSRAPWKGWGEAAVWAALALASGVAMPGLGTPLLVEAPWSLHGLPWWSCLVQAGWASVGLLALVLVGLATNPEEAGGPLARLARKTLARAALAAAAGSALSWAVA